MCVYYVPAWCYRIEKGVSDPLELELEMVISHHIGDGTESGSYAGVTGNPSRPIIIIIV